MTQSPDCRIFMEGRAKMGKIFQIVGRENYNRLRVIGSEIYKKPPYARAPGGSKTSKYMMENATISTAWA